MRHKYLNPPIGKMFGKWKVLSYSHYTNEHYWDVLCTGCNTTHKRRGGQLVLGRSSGCQHCNAVARERYSFWEGIDGISKQYITKLTFRKQEVTITLQDIVDQWHQQKGICAYSGLQLTVVQKDCDWTTSTASIDRIDSSKGYIKGNIQWVHKRVNTMKSDMTEDQFITFCYQIANYTGGNYGGSCGV